MACILTSVQLDPVRVYVKKPMQWGKIRTVEPTLENVRDLVGGFIKVFYIPSIPNVYGYFNPPAKFKGADPNFYIPEKNEEMVGNTIFFRLDKEGYMKDIKDRDIDKLDNYMANNMYKDREHFYEHMTDLYGMYL